MSILTLIFFYKRLYFLLIFLGLHTCYLWGQHLDSTYENSPTQHVFLLSNLENVEANSNIFEQLKKIVAQVEGESTLLFNGDFLDKNGINASPTPKEKEKINSLLQLAAAAQQSIFLNGDKEWDNAGKNGLEKVNALEKLLKKEENTKLFVAPENGCVGPEIIDIGTNLRIIAINTQWWIHRFQRPIEEDLKCPTYNEIEFWDDLEDAIQDSDNRNVIIAAHHPILSYGQYAGYALTKQHFLPPVIGSFVAGYHLSVGSKKDLTQAKFEAYAKEFITRLQRYAPVIYTSGHEYDLQINQLDGSYHLNSGSIQKAMPTSKGKFTEFKEAKRGFIQLEFFKTGQVNANIWTIQADGTFQHTHQKTLYQSACPSTKNDPNLPFNQQYYPCITKDSTAQFEVPKVGKAIASAQFKASKLKQFFMGKHYRTVWGAEIKEVPYLNLDTLHGGLTPTSKGGGGQTVSLKFKAKDGQEFAFRLFEKQPNKKIDKELKGNIFVELMEDVTATQHPYAPLVVSYFMEVLGLPHSQPQIYLMPDHPRLGPYREEFAGTYGWWEIKPTEKKKGQKGFQNADEVDSTFKLYETLMSSHENTFDTEAYALARLFDMWISDWDRHQDNWKWLGYENEEGGLDYIPFAKDRDKTFNLFQGLYQLMDWEILDNYRARFRESYRSVKSLNNKAKNLDRILANEFTYEDWMKTVTKFENLMTDEVIDSALQHFPKEVYDLSAPEIEKILKLRRATLRAAVTKFYAHLAEEVVVVGTNKHEIFEVERLENGEVMVEVFGSSKEQEKKKLLYSRHFKPKETKEINLYGLGKEDIFDIKGYAKSSILVRVIGGKGKDSIIDTSTVKGAKHKTKVYDFGRKDSLQLNSEATLAHQHREVFFETEKIHEDDAFFFVPFITYNVDDRWGVGFTMSSTLQKFQKPDFGIKYGLTVQAYTNRNYSLDFSTEFREAIDKWSLFVRVLAARPYNQHQFFYGLGNETTLIDELSQDDFYRNKTTILNGKIGLSRTFWKKSQVLLSTNYEYQGVENFLDEDLDFSIYDVLKPYGFGEITFLGLEENVNLDLRDDAIFPTRGAQFKMQNYSFFNIRDAFKFGGRMEVEALFYYTIGIKLPVTIGFRAGHANNYGEVPFYHQSYLGQQSNLRGFRENRFGGSSATFINTDVRFHLGTLWTRVLPLRFGVYGLFDAGRVDQEGESSKKIHYSLGGGAYLIPYLNDFTLNFYLAQPNEGVALFNLRIGFFVR